MSHDVGIIKQPRRLELLGDGEWHISYRGGTAKWYWPTTAAYATYGTASISSRFGYRDYGDYDPFHKGIDIKTPIGTPVYSPCSGKVIEINNNKDAAGGCTVLIQLDNGYYVRYYHLKKDTLIANNTRVSAGQQIAQSGDTGGVPAHLHFQVQRTSDPNTSINPLMGYCDKDKRGENPNPIYIKNSSGKYEFNTNFNPNYYDAYYMGIGDSYKLTGTKETKYLDLY